MLSPEETLALVALEDGSDADGTASILITDADDDVARLSEANSSDLEEGTVAHLWTGVFGCNLDEPAARALAKFLLEVADLEKAKAARA